MIKERFSFLFRWNDEDNRIKKIVGVSARFILFIVLSLMIHFSICFTAYKSFELNLFWGEAAMKMETSNINAGVISYSKESIISNGNHRKDIQMLTYTVLDKEDIALLYPSWKIDPTQKKYIEEQNLPRKKLQNWEYGFHKSGYVMSSPFQVIPYLQYQGYELKNVFYAYILSFVFLVAMAVIAILIILLVKELCKKIFEIIVRGI